MVKRYAVTMFKGTGYWAVRDTYDEAVEAAKTAKTLGYDGEIKEIGDDSL